VIDNITASQVCEAKQETDKDKVSSPRNERDRWTQKEQQESGMK